MNGLIPRTRRLNIMAPGPALARRTDLAKLPPVCAKLGIPLRYFGWERETGELDAARWCASDVEEKAILGGGGYGLKSRRHYPRWIAAVFREVLRLDRGEIVWAVGWETAYPALLAARAVGATVIFYDPDRFSMVVRLPNPIDGFVRRLESWSSHAARLHVIPGYARYEWSHENMRLLRNSPMQETLAAARKTSIPRPDATIVLNANGWLGETRGAGVILKAMQLLEDRGVNAHLLAAGRTDSASGKELVGRSDVTFFGEIPQTEALALYPSSDLALTLYDPKIEINRKAEPNKWGDAAYFGTPVIVNDGVETAQPLLENGAAMRFPYDRPDALADLIEALSKDHERLARCRSAIAAMADDWPPYDTRLAEILSEILPV